GAERATLCRSTLPYLVEQKRIRWRRGKGTKAGEFILPKPDLQNDTTKITTHFSGVSLKVLLGTLKLLIRMRGGGSNGAILDRQGPLVMFATVALLQAGARGYRAEEVPEGVGRKVSGKAFSDLMARMKAAGIARERSPGCYALTDSFRRAYEQQLEHSG